MHSFSTSTKRRPLSRAQTSIGSTQMMDTHFQGQQQQQQQHFGMHMGHRHSMSVPGQAHMPQQPSNLSLQTSVSHDMGDMDDSGIGMSLMDDDALAKFSFSAADMGNQLMSHGEVGVNMV